MPQPTSQIASQSASGKLERIAVVFIHGQGQQTPMTDVIALAESVWRTDPHASDEPLAWASPAKASDAAVCACEQTLASVYSVPVYDHQASEQRRIVTRQVQVSGRDDGVSHVQADFFQFYWADLMQGNRFAQLWTWFHALVEKDPLQNVVPLALLPLRRLTLGLGMAVALWGWLLGAVTVAALLARPWAFHLALVLGCVVGLAVAATVTARLLPSKAGQPPFLIRAIDRLSPSFSNLPLLLGAVLIGLGIYLTARRAVIGVAELLAILLSAAVGLQTVYLATPRRKGLSSAFGLGLGLIAACGLLGPFADRLRDAASPFCANLEVFLDYLLGVTIVPAFGVGILGYMLARSFLVPVMTESARMFTPSPDNIRNHEQIRERGLKLLEYLHASSAGYDRIVVLAHSLGTAVGYNLLTYYWGKVNDALDHPGTMAARERVTTCAAAVINNDAPPDLPAFRAWRAAVRAYGDALRRMPATAGPAPQPSGWRISDFITIGSPLTYAPFLMEPSDNSFIDQVETYRRYPLCPPQSVNGPSGTYRFDFPNEGVDTPHHAALFAATCWTNLYFPARGLVWGDLIGGPIAGLLGTKQNAAKPLWTSDTRRGLGYGVLDSRVEHDRRLGWFTHNLYWPWPDWLRDDLGSPVGLCHPPQHIRMLRAAFHFFEPACRADDELLAAAVKT